MKADINVISRKIVHLERLCRSRGFPFTVQRRVIMEELAGRSDHPTADQVYESIRERLPGVSLTTVYRVLDAFVRLKIIRKVCNAEAKARYDADTSRHHHLQCLVCGSVIDVHAHSLDNLPLPDCSANGFEIIDYSVDFTGVCTVCGNAAAN